MLLHTTSEPALSVFSHFTVVWLETHKCVTHRVSGWPSDVLSICIMLWYNGHRCTETVFLCITSEQFLFGFMAF